MLPAEAWQLFSILLSFLSPEGGSRFTLDQIAFVLDLKTEEVIKRLLTLEKIDWQSESLICILYDGNGEISGAALASNTLTDQITVSPANDPAPSPELAPPDDGLREELVQVGLYAEQIDRLFARFSVTQIRQQLAWLPARKPRNPAALLLKAIQENWQAPQGPHEIPE